MAREWGLWCEKGYLDFVCPMDYAANSALLDTRVANQKRWAGGVPCYPGLGPSTWSTPDDLARLIEQVGVTRRHKTGGFAVFRYGVAEAQTLVPLCGLGITRPQENELAPASRTVPSLGYGSN